MELTIGNINVDLETGTVKITGYDAGEIVSEIGTTKLLNAMEYSDIMEYIKDVEEEKRDLEEDYRSLVG